MVLAHLERPSKLWALTVTLVKEKEKGWHMMSNWTLDTGQNFGNHQLQKKESHTPNQTRSFTCCLFPDLAYQQKKSWSQSSPDYQAPCSHLKWPHVSMSPMTRKTVRIQKGTLWTPGTFKSLLAHALDKAFFSIHIGQSVPLIERTMFIKAHLDRICMHTPKPSLHLKSPLPPSHNTWHFWQEQEC